MHDKAPLTKEVDPEFERLLREEEEIEREDAARRYRKEVLQRVQDVCKVRDNGDLGHDEVVEILRKILDEVLDTHLGLR